MESRELPKRIFKLFINNVMEESVQDLMEESVQDLLDQGYIIESMTTNDCYLYLYLTLDPNAAPQLADPKS